MMKMASVNAWQDMVGMQRRATSVAVSVASMDTRQKQATGTAIRALREVLYRKGSLL